MKNHQTKINYNLQYTSLKASTSCLSLLLTFFVRPSHFHFLKGKYKQKNTSNIGFFLKNSNHQIMVNGLKF